MPDLGSVLARVENEVAVVTRRCEELDRERAVLDRQRVRLVAAVEVMKEHAGEAVPPSASGEPADPQPLTERILAALVDGAAHRRTDLLRMFRPLGLNENTIDSAVHRLKKRGVVRREGRRLVPVLQPSAPASAAESSRASSAESDRDRSQDDLAPVAVDLALGRAAVPGAVSVPDGSSVGSAPAPTDQAPLTVRVREAVATSLATTRATLVRHFAAQEVKDSAVDAALAGLRKRGRLERRAGGVLAVPRADVLSVPADAAPEDSSQGS